MFSIPSAACRLTRRTARRSTRRRAIDRCQHREELAALVIEPMMQGAAGMWNHSARLSARGVETGARGWRAGDLRRGRDRLRPHGQDVRVPSTRDLAPDLMCLGKGITGGYLPLAATLATEKIFEAFLGEPQEYPRILLWPYLYRESAGRGGRGRQP